MKLVFKGNFSLALAIRVGQYIENNQVELMLLKRPIYKAGFRIYKEDWNKTKLIIEAL